MNLQDYKRIDRRSIHPYPVCLVTPGYNVFFKKHFKMDFPTVFFVYEKGMWNVVINTQKWAESKFIVENLYKKDNKIIDKFIKQFEADSKKYLSFTKTLIKKDYVNLSDNQILGLYLKFNKGYAKCFCYGEPPAQRLKDLIEEQLREELMAILKDENKVNKIFTVLVMPTQDTFIINEEKSLLKLAILAKKKGIDNIKKEIEQHAENYNWISVDYNGDPISLDEFKMNIANALKENPEKRLEDLNQRNLKIKKEQRGIRENYKLPDSIFVKCLTAQKCIMLMDKKKAIFSEAHYHVQFLMAEIGKRLGLSLKQICYFMPEEIEECLNKGKTIDKDIAEKRYERSAYVLDDFDMRIATEDEESQLRSLFKDKNEVHELKGICGNPGKATGKARIIVKTSEFHKFQKGDILVTAFTTPDFTPVIKKAAAIVTDFGGITSHASIISREMNIPCVVGTEHATTSIKDGDIIEVDANKCVVRKVK